MMIPIALMIISASAKEAFLHCTKKWKITPFPLTPFQRDLAISLLPAFVPVCNLLTKTNLPPAETPRPNAGAQGPNAGINGGNSHHAETERVAETPRLSEVSSRRHLAQDPREVNANQGPLVIYRLLRGVRLTRQDLQSIALALESFDQAIQDKRCVYTCLTASLGERTIRLPVDLSSGERRLQALQIHQALVKLLFPAKKKRRFHVLEGNAAQMRLEGEALQAEGGITPWHLFQEELVSPRACSLPNVDRKTLSLFLKNVGKSVQTTRAVHTHRSYNLNFLRKMRWVTFNVSTPTEREEVVLLCNFWKNRLLGIQPLVRELTFRQGSNWDARQSPNWDAFNDYVLRYCTNVNLPEARKKASQGLRLIQRLYQNEQVEQKNCKKRLLDVCWGLMLIAVSRGEDFVEGTFSIEDPDYCLFRFFKPIFYNRLSSHYSKRINSSEKGSWIGNHFGYDTELGKLPANKRTVLVGCICQRDDTDWIYLKMENWGANPFDPQKMDHLIWHLYEFITSQISRRLGTVGTGPNMRKEHMLPEHKLRCKELYTKICIEIEGASIQNKTFDVNEYGFQDAIPFFSRVALQQHKLSDELRTEIESFIQEVRIHYPDLNHAEGKNYRKGNEVLITKDIILSFNPTLPRNNPGEFLGGSYVSVESDHVVEDGYVMVQP